MTSTQIKEFKSKEACPRCSAHKLFTNDTAKDSPSFHYHCLNCSHEFSVSAEAKERQKKAKRRKGQKDESFLGIAVIALIVLVISLVTISQQENEQEQNTLQPSSRIEALKRREA